MLYPYAQVRIYTEEPIETVATQVSEKLFGGIPFVEKELGRFEEVPSMRLRDNVLGLIAAIHGQDGEYVLLIQPAPKSIGEKGTDVSISEYIAELVRAIKNWRVELPK